MFIGGFRPLKNHPVLRTLPLCSCPNHLSPTLQVLLQNFQRAPPLWCLRPHSPRTNTNPPLDPANLLHLVSILVCNDGPVEGVHWVKFKPPSRRQKHLAPGGERQETCLKETIFCRLDISVTTQLKNQHENTDMFLILVAIHLRINADWYQDCNIMTGEESEVFACLLCLGFIIWALFFFVLDRMILFCFL